MCEMEVSPTFATDAILQAMAHNTSTIDRDMDMVKHVLKARGEMEKLAAAERFQNLIHEAYALMLGEYGMAVAEVSMEKDGRILHGHREAHSSDEKFGMEKSPHGHDNGNGTHTHGDGTIHNNDIPIIREIVESTDMAHSYETR